MSGSASTDEIRGRYEVLLERLRDVAEAHGHDRNRLRIVGVTKGHSVELVRAAVAAGITLLGESRVQEAEPKIDAVADVEWHFIGRLQSNKARRAVRRFQVIHSVDSLEMLARIGEVAVEEGRVPNNRLIQVNVTGESSKAGLSPAAVLAAPAVDQIALHEVHGLMTIAPLGASAEEARAAFRRLRELRDRLSEATGMGLPELSMGMSADAEAAAAEGATLVRIGTALFGPRG